MAKKKQAEEFAYAIQVLLRQIESLDKKKEDIKLTQRTMFTEENEFEKHIIKLTLYKSELLECIDIIKSKKKKKESVQLDMFIHSGNKK